MAKWVTLDCDSEPSPFCSQLMTYIQLLSINVVEKKRIKNPSDINYFVLFSIYYADQNILYMLSSVENNETFSHLRRFSFIVIY